MRRLRRQLKPGDVVLFTDWTLLRLFPPLRRAWAPVGTPAIVPITGANAKCALFGALNPRTGHRVVRVFATANAAAAQAFLQEVRTAYRGAGTLWLLLDRGSAHTARGTQALAAALDIRLVWLPRQASELNAMDQLWKELKRLIAANRQTDALWELATHAMWWVLHLAPAEALRKAGVLSPHFWLKHV